MDSALSLIDHLQQRLQARPSKALATTLATEAMTNHKTLEILFSFIYDGDNSLRWRAAWTLEMVSKGKPSLVVNERKQIKTLAMQSSTPEGLRRLLFSILHHLPEEPNLDVEFFNFLLDKMLDPKSPPGVQALAMKLAERMSRINGELHKEFLCIVSNMETDYYSAGVKSVIRNCLKAREKLTVSASHPN